MNITYGVGAMLGAALGGAMADYLGWRWEFGVQVPLMMAAVVVAVLVVPDNLGLEGKEKQTLREALRTFDVKGSILLSTSVTFLILGLVSSVRVVNRNRSADKSEPRRKRSALVTPVRHRVAGHLHRPRPPLHPR